MKKPSEAFRKPQCGASARPTAFTLIEILVVVAIVGILAVLLTGNLSRIMEKAQGAKCAGNLKAIGAASGLYLADNNGLLPVALKQATSALDSSGWESPEVGAWYWNLAPYLSVTRWDSVHKYLGPEGKYVLSPNVFTCPSHGSKEVLPIKFPSLMPVSYAPSTAMSPPNITWSTATANFYRLSIFDIKGLSKKIWVSDSTHPTSLNVSVKRWKPEEPEATAWPRQAFTRHGGAGNALFFDGHVESLPYLSIANENLSENIQRLFQPMTVIP